MNVVGPDEPVVVLGSGLTAVDTVLSLHQQPRTAPITLVSRRGLLPQPHADTPVPPVDWQPLVAELVSTPGGVRTRALLGKVRQLARQQAKAGGDWRGVVDGLRPHTETLWRAMPTAERQRFLAQVRPFWEVHRHRMALTVAGRFRTLLDSGLVRLVAGRVESAQAEGDSLRLVLRERQTERLIPTDAAWVVNCTGPMPSNSVESNPAIASLIVQGLLLPDELLLGVETTTEGHALAENGQALGDLFVVGTLRKPAAWESTAVPELRNQAAAVAEQVLALLGQRAPLAGSADVNGRTMPSLGAAV
jgi:uncharacterized NAD(P)/FAD-binding protein YdhS